MQSLFKILASENRLKILEILLESEEKICYCEIVDELGKDKSVVYRHFRKLEESGLIETSKDGKKLEGQIRNPKKLEKLLDTAEEVCNNGS